MKQCVQCNQIKNLTEFYKGTRCLLGVRPECKRCFLDNRKEYDMLHRDEHIEYGRQYLAEHREENKRKCQIRYNQNKQEYKGNARQWAIENPEKVKESGKKFRKENRVQENVRLKKIKLEREHRTPKWLTEADWIEINKSYQLAFDKTKITGIQYDVDHIIPLKGKLISGLHVPSNLQVITHKENMKKSNKFGGI